jgi:septum formation protein
VRPTDVEELDRGDPGEVALENALRKARAARRWGAEMGATAAVSAGAGTEAEAEAEAEVVLGCDTLVALDGTIYGKPRDEAEARATLRALSGATHEVFSGLVLLFGGGLERTAIVRTAVRFRELEERTLDWYLAKREWRGRAGGYAIQGAGAALVRAVDGDYENVVGLPLARLLDIYPDLLTDPQ